MNEWDEWKKQQEAKQTQINQDRADFVKQYKSSLSSDKRPITEREKQAIMLLAACRFLPGSWDKQFVYHFYKMKDGVNQPPEVISDKQSYWLGKLIYKYRKQLGLSPIKAREFITGGSTETVLLPGL